ncbi:hypothetical protein [Cognaticolwellia mytili]|uniref:hypothetical protein n=1 Tax=Cognaticolwellia mytili TaxID=1888913 RepID=UPI000A174EA3|nr:hypothetical protein [Cognaticolwellia mytili]
MTKFEIAISAVLLGFILSQSVDLFKYRWRISRKKKAIKDEVKELAVEFDERISRIGTILNDIANEKLSGIPTPSIIPDIIYKNHYAEVAPFFKPSERKAISLIYSGVNNYNEEAENKNSPDLHAKKKSLVELYYYCQMGKTSAEYFNKYGGKNLLHKEHSKLKEINETVNTFASKHITQ